MLRLSHPGSVHRAAGNRLVEVNVAVSDLDVESAGRVAAHPRLVVDGRSLASKVTQRQQAALAAVLAFGPTVLFQRSFLTFRPVVVGGGKYTTRKLELPSLD